MSRTRPTVAERRMLEFPCGRCDAAVGEWCTSPRLHSARFYTATDAGRLPLDAP